MKYSHVHKNCFANLFSTKLQAVSNRWQTVKLSKDELTTYKAIKQNEKFI